MANLHVTEEMRARAWEALERMEATKLAGQLVGTMSAGEKRRIMIARRWCTGRGNCFSTSPPTRWTWPRNANCARPCATGARGNGPGDGDASSGDILPEIERIILMRDGRIVGDGPRENC